MHAIRRTVGLRAFSAAALALALTPFTGTAVAQDKWPSKPIVYIVPFPAGGTTDVLARLIGQKLGPVLGTTIVVDNKGGAGGSVGSEMASRAAPDGYTILGGTISSHAITSCSVLYGLFWLTTRTVGLVPISVIGMIDATGS